MFINTIDLIGDDATATKIIDGSITEMADNILTSIGSYVFYSCSNLTTVDFPSATMIGMRVFYYCSNLTAVILRGNTMCALQSSDAFYGSAIASGSGYIYVPSALVDTYKSATNWSSHATRFRALEDYTVDGTTTGELDPTKI